MVRHRQRRAGTTPPVPKQSRREKTRTNGADKGENSGEQELTGTNARFRRQHRRHKTTGTDARKEITRRERNRAATTAAMNNRCGVVACEQHHTHIKNTGEATGFRRDREQGKRERIEDLGVFGASGFFHEILEFSLGLTK